MRRGHSPAALLFVAAVIVLALVVHEWHWLVVHLLQEMGISNSASRAYNGWSGFGSDVGEVTIVVGIVAFFRHHNCHVRRCPRLGKPVAGTPYVACPRHHPAHKGDKRGVSVATIESAHENRRR